MGTHERKNEDERPESGRESEEGNSDSDVKEATPSAIEEKDNKVGNRVTNMNSRCNEESQRSRENINDNLDKPVVQSVDAQRPDATDQSAKRHSDLRRERE